MFKEIKQLMVKRMALIYEYLFFQHKKGFVQCDYYAVAER